MLSVGGARWDKNVQRWKVPLTWAACQQLRGVFGAGLEITQDLQDWAWQEKNTRVGPALQFRDMLSLNGNLPLREMEAARISGAVVSWLDKIEDDTDLQLKDFQRADVTFLVACGQALLGSEPGTGKTAAAIRTLQVLSRMGLEPFPALVVCPNSLKNTVWVRELSRWAPDMRVAVVQGTALKRRKIIAGDWDVLVINYEALRAHTRQAPYGTLHLTDKQKERKELNGLGLRTVICDEAHRIKDPSTQLTRAVWAVLQEAEYRYLLTGTPVNNHVGDLWALLHGILPEWFPSRTRYIERYCSVGYNWFGGTEILGLKPENAAEFRAVTEPVMRRVLKATVLPQLPEKMPTMYRETWMSPKQAKAYAELEHSLLTWLDSGEMIAAPSTFSQLARLVQFASAYAEVDENGAVKLTEPSSKVDDLIDLLDEMGEDEPLVVAAVSRQLIELAAARLTEHKIPHALVTGAVSVPDRARSVEDFQSGRARVILLTLGAGAEGLTLTRASTILFMQESWSPLQNTQAIDRIHRIGSEGHDRIRIIVQLAPGTIEERKIEVLGAKHARIEEALADKEVLRRLLGAR